MFSHYSEDHCDIEPAESKAAAEAAGERIATAQPGIEYELMTRVPGQPWLSVADGETLRQVIERRWPRFYAGTARLTP